MPAMMSGNTDSYQPAEDKFRLTRQCLEVLHELNHPVGIITKNSLVVRDLDLLAEMARHDLVHVCFSITTLEEDVRRLLEPRTASISQRFRAVESLSKAGIPVMVNIAPVIPGLTDHELFSIAKRASEAGARRIRDCRGGELGEKRFGIRHRGEGELARLIEQQYQLAKRRFFPGPVDWPVYDFSLFEQRRCPQLRLL